MAAKQTKFIFVTGGVLSGLGKGITAASLGTILRARGFTVNIQKLDPYFNTDAGTLNPAEHGECFVTKDGAETDLDLGHYERFLDEELTRSSSVMNGRIYAQVIADERAGKYLGKTVQIIPHVTNEIQAQVLTAAAGFDVHIVEVGGTVGDYESLATLEALRQLRRSIGYDNSISIHLVYLPYLEASQEIKTKPAQNTVRDLREAGIQPEVIIARSERPVSDGVIKKLALYCDVEPEGIIPVETVATVYEVPLMLEASGLGKYVSGLLNLPKREPKLEAWTELVTRIKQPDHRTIKIGIVAKYLDNSDTYISVIEALKSAGWAKHLKPEVTWVDAEALTPESIDEHLAGLDGIVVPGGFGSRGVEGKILAAQYARKHTLPYLGLCLGMQVAVIAVARDAGLAGANTTEIDTNSPYPVISLMADQEQVTDLGGTMRLGDYPCELAKGSHAAAAYGTSKIVERHRHRYEFNNAYREQIEAAGLKLSGLSPNGHLVEVVELSDHPFFVASQFHPEFKSRPQRPHPLFAGFVEAAAK